MKKVVFSFVLIILALTSCKKVFFQPEPENTREAVFENLYKNFVESYGPTNERHIDWNNLYATYRPQVSNNMTDQELRDVITTMLSHLNDGHVTLTSPGQPLFNSNAIFNNKTGDKLFNKDIIQANYLESGYNSGEGYFYGKIKNENLGYIWFEYVADNFFVLEDFLDQNSSSDGIIIDMRHNSGGDFTYSFSSMGRLTQNDVYVFQSRTKNGPGANDFTAWYRWNLKAEGSYFNKPIVLLTDRYTISAGERTVMALQSLPNVTTIGDYTCGAHATMIGRELANGWYYTLPTQETFFNDGQCYEGIGLAPDITSINSQVDVDNGIDNTLQDGIDHF